MNSATSAAGAGPAGSDGVDISAMDFPAAAGDNNNGLRRWLTGVSPSPKALRQNVKKRCCLSSFSTHKDEFLLTRPARQPTMTIERLDAMEKFVIRGTRGSMPACGRPFLKYGGETTCFSLETDEGTVIFDAGTGITSLNDVLSSDADGPPITIMFTHFHLDHVMGLPCFRPLYGKVPITFMADGNRNDDWRETLKTLVASPYWPANLSASGASTFQNLPTNTDSMRICGTRISWCPVFHPQGCLAYKIETSDCAIVIATDHEHADSDVRAGFFEFCKKADFLIYDAMYTPQEYVRHNGWGHGNWQQGVQLAMEAQAGELILTHHNIHRTDEQIDEIVAKARAYFPATRAAAANTVLAH